MCSVCLLFDTGEYFNAEKPFYQWMQILQHQLKHFTSREILQTGSHSFAEWRLKNGFCRRGLDGKGELDFWTGLRTFKNSNYVSYFAILFLTHYYTLDTLIILCWKNL